MQQLTLLLLTLVHVVGGVRTQPIKIGPMRIARMLNGTNRTNAIDKSLLAGNERKRDDVGTGQVPTPIIGHFAPGDPRAPHQHNVCSCDLNVVYLQIVVFFAALLMTIGIIEWARRKNERMKE